VAETTRCPIVIGIGNPDRGDDAAGRLVAQQLSHLLQPDVTVIEIDGEVSSLLAHLETASAAWLIDACKSGAPAGTIHRFDAGTTVLPKDLHDVSSHALGLAEAIELARALGRLPSHCIVYAIEATSFEHGEPVSPAVAKAVDDVVELVANDIRALPGQEFG
jgi:hydrogenase maturation protease